MNDAKILREYYEKHYLESQRCGIQGWGNSLIDRMIEKLGGGRKHNARILEIGASSGEHIKYVKKDPLWQSYNALDLMPGATDDELLRSLTTRKQVNFIAGDAESLPFHDDIFDHIKSTCVLAHTRDPNTVFKELRRVTANEGTITVGMPCDPGLVNRAIKSLITYRGMRKQGIKNPKLIYALGHVNPISNLLTIASDIYKYDQIKLDYFPLKVPSWNLNILVTLHVKILK